MGHAEHQAGSAGGARTLGSVTAARASALAPGGQLPAGNRLTRATPPATLPVPSGACLSQ